MTRKVIILADKFSSLCALARSSFNGPRACLLARPWLVCITNGPRVRILTRLNKD
jgi:hypothetical protein